MKYHQDYQRFRLAQRVHQSNIDFLWSDPVTSVISTTGLQNQSLENVTADETKTCETSKEQLTPKIQQQGEIDTSELPSDVAEIVAVWPELPAHIKAAIKALAKTHDVENE